MTNVEALDPEGGEHVVGGFFFPRVGYSMVWDSEVARRKWKREERTKLY